MRRAFAAISAVIALAGALTLISQPAGATPPNIPSASTAASRLATLTVAAESHQSTYDRSLFPHWITISAIPSTLVATLRFHRTPTLPPTSTTALVSAMLFLVSRIRVTTCPNTQLLISPSARILLNDSPPR